MVGSGGCADASDKVGVSIRAVALLYAMRRQRSVKSGSSPACVPMCVVGCVSSYLSLVCVPGVCVWYASLYVSLDACPWICLCIYVPGMCPWNVYLVRISLDIFLWFARAVFSSLCLVSTLKNDQ